MTLKPGDEVQLMGIHRTVRVYCDDETCELNPHRWEGVELDPETGEQVGVSGRFHREDGPREGVPAVVLSLQPAPVLKRPKAGYALPSATGELQEDGSVVTPEGLIVADMRNDDHWDTFAIPGAKERVELLLEGGTVATADIDDVEAT